MADITYSYLVQEQQSYLVQEQQIVDITNVPVPGQSQNWTYDTYWWTYFSADIYGSMGTNYAHTTTDTPEKINTINGDIYIGISYTYKSSQLYANDYRAVKLTSSIDKDYYYSFKTGKQYVEVADNWQCSVINKDFLPVKVQTYEYIDSYKSNTAYAAYQNVYYTYSYLEYSYIKTDVPYNNLKEAYENITNKGKYTISISYTQNSVAYTFVELKNNNSQSRIYGTNTYENEFVHYTYDPSVNSEALQYLSLYSRTNSYTTLSASELSYVKAADPKNTSKKFYYYNPLLKSYVLCGTQDIGKYTNTYIVATTYTQINDVLANYKKSNDFYIKNPDWNKVDTSTTPSDTSIYVSTETLHNQKIHIPHNTGIVTDGSVDYYAYTYVLISDDNFNNDEISELYIKQNYRELSFEEQQKYIAAGYDIYEQSVAIQPISISTTTLLDSIVTDGSIIYTYYDGETILSLAALKAYLSACLSNFKDASTDDIEKAKQSTLNGTSTDYSATQIVKSKLNYAGLYTIVSNPIPDASKTYFVKETGYTKIDKKYYSAGSNQEFYVYKLGKIDSKDIKSFTDKSYFEDVSKLYQYSNSEEIIYDTTTTAYDDTVIYLGAVNAYGFVERLKYYTKLISCVPTTDWYMLPNKQYYTYNKQGTTISNDGRITVSMKAMHYTDDVLSIDGYDDIDAFDENSVKYYIYTNTGYSICPNADIYKYISGALKIHTEFMHTKYFYPTYTINDGIHLTKGGTYYTNIYVFDNKKGAISKMLYLDQHVIDTTNYSYSVNTSNWSFVSSSVELQQVSQIDYGEYGYLDGNEIKPLPSNVSPYAYALSGHDIYKKSYHTRTFKYNGTSPQCTYNKLPFVLQYGDLQIGMLATGDSQQEITKPLTYTATKMYMFTHNTTSAHIISGTYTSTNNTLVNKISLSLSNEVSYDATGSYIWHEPSYMSAIAYKDGESCTYHWYDSIGWWEKEYKRNVNPLLVSSYTFYPDTNSISNITATYSFVPNSYVLTAAIEYPEISYSTLVNEQSEYFYYTYFDDHGNVKNYNGQVYWDKKKQSYIGSDGKVEVTRVRGVRSNIIETDYVNQEHTFAYTYFAYKTAMELTNEKVPYLYNTELRPAVTKEVNVWNSDTASYETKTVIASYAYYSYNYMYDTIPFKTASYIFQGSYLTIDNFYKLGAYITDASDGLTSILSYQVNSIDKFDTNMSELTAQEVAAINNAYTLMVNAMNAASAASSANSYASRTQLTNDIHNLSYDLSNTLTDNLCNVSSNVSSLDTHLNDNFTTFNSYYTYQNDTNRNTLSEDISALRSYMHADMAGTSILSYVTTAVDKDGNIVWEASDKSDITTSISDTLRNLLTNVKTTTTTYTKDGLTYTTVQYAYTGIGNMLNRLEIAQAAPTKKEFVVDVAAKLFTSVDFETEVVDSVQYDENGNITDKKSHKNNPTEIAKKSIYRATVLWKELEKEGFV